MLAVLRATAGPTTVRRVTERHPELRVSDAEREATVGRLRVAGGEGRLTLEELGERVELADAARTRGDLEALTADLPDTGRRFSRRSSRRRSATGSWR